MDCKRHKYQIFLHQETDESRRHQQTCTECQQIKTLNTMIEQTVAEQEDPFLPADFAERVMEEIRTIFWNNRRKNLYYERLFALAGIFLIIGIGTLFMINDYLLLINPSLIDYLAGYISLPLGVVLTALSLFFCFTFLYQKQKQEDEERVAGVNGFIGEYSEDEADWVIQNSSENKRN
jgi:hypothetical protein